MQQMVVKPPAAAAREPVSMVSACSNPGSRRWTCMSMKPGATTSPEASNSSAPVASMESPMAAMTPASMATSRTASSPEAGSMTRPFLITSRAISVGHLLGRESAFEDGHANGHTIFDLIEDDRFLGIGDLGGDFAAAIDGTGVHDDSVAMGQFQMLRPEAVKAEVLGGGYRGLVLPLQLNAQHHDHVGIANGIADVVGEAYSGSDPGQFRGKQRRRTAEHGLRAVTGKQVDVGACHAAVGDVADDGHVQILEGAAAVENGARIEQSLGGVLVGAVAGVDDG